MKKFAKILIGIVVTLIVLLVVFLLTLPFTITPIVKTAAAAGSKVLDVPIEVGAVKLNPLGGHMTIHDVRVGNPKGYSEKDAFAVDRMDVGLNLMSLRSDTIVVRKIAIDAPAILYETKGGVSNFDTILARVKKASEEEKTKKDKEKAPGKKVVIEEFTLSGAKVAYASGLTMGQAITLPLPTVELRDIGKASGGASAIDAVTEIVNGILSGLAKAVSNVAGAATNLLKSAGGTASDAAKSAGAALGNLTSGTSDAVKSAEDAAKDAAKGATDAAKSAAENLKKLNPFKK